jgi:hypothetical protein
MRSIVCLLFAISVSVPAYGQASVDASLSPQDGGLSFSVPSGFYHSPFTLEIISGDPARKVIYTLDGSNPQYSKTALSGSDTARILVDPALGTGRPRTPGFVVRASSMEEGSLPSLPASRSYIFPDAVPDQSYPGGGWPYSSINGQVIDLDMDERIADHPAYSGEMPEALTAVPSVSLVTDLASLFDPDTGIYVNADGHGPAWERECSVSLLYPDGSEGFDVNAGLRIRGGWSRHPEFPKHAFRLFFRGDYGDPKLYYPLFGDEGVDHFDKVDLRTSMNYAWAQGDGRNTMLRDVFSRDTQRDMGQAYTRSRYYHLYLNGMYWGLYQSQERSEARYASDYFGGDPEDYDVIKVNTEDYVYQIEATDGTTEAWWTLWEMCFEGFRDNARYFSLMGLDDQGRVLPGGEVLVDMDNLIDYMIAIFYTGNFDSPTAVFMGNKKPNNFYAVGNREDPDQGFRFFIHDAEHSIFPYPAPPGEGITEDRVNLTEREDGNHMDVYNFSSFHPQWLHHKLTDNAEYRMRFMDRVIFHMNEAGSLSREACLDRLNTRALQIESAIIAESARWGDGSGRVEPCTRDEHWLPEVNKIRYEFFPYRTPIVIGQLKHAGLYPELTAPVFSVDGVDLSAQEVPVQGSEQLLIENLNVSGNIWYTLDGTDPRAVGGGIAPTSKPGGTGETLLQLDGSARVKARIRSGNDWSALKDVQLIAPQEDFSRLAVTEIHYHPLELVVSGDTVASQDLEFIEFKNMDLSAMNLGGLVLDSAVYYEFPENTLLPPRQFYVLASRPPDFYRRYGMHASGNYKKNLSNAGDEILLRDREGNPVIHFSYSDSLPWPVEADGGGYSLVPTLHDPTGYPGDASYWKASRDVGGSPFRNDPYPLSADAGITDGDDITIYPNPGPGQIRIIWPDGLEPGRISISLYGLNGALLLQMEGEGRKEISLDRTRLGPGLYLLKISAGGKEFMKKVILQ